MGFFLIEGERLLDQLAQYGTSSGLCHWLHLFRSMRNADGQIGAVFLLVKLGWDRRTV